MAELPYQPVSYSAHAALSALEARRHLDNIDTPVLSALPYKPKGGELFLVEVDQESKRNDWRSNGHHFYQVKGGKPCVAGNAENLIIRKTANLRTAENKR